MPLHLNSGIKGCEEKKTNNEEIHHCYLGTTRKILKIIVWKLSRGLSNQYLLHAK